MQQEVGFSCDYAKSRRSTCKKCKSKIEKHSLRMAIMVQAHKFDGVMPLWYHVNCFFEKKKNVNVENIENFTNLRWDDQEKIKAKMSGGGSSAPRSFEGNEEFTVEYAISGRAACRNCARKIEKAEIRISKLDTESESAQRLGGISRWYHVECFVNKRTELGFFYTASSLSGYQNIKNYDQKLLDEKIIVISNKRNAEEDVAPPAKLIKSSCEESEILKDQNRLLYLMRDGLKELSKKEMAQLLEHNNQHVPAGESQVLDHLSDCLVFGALDQCPDCKNAAPRFNVNIYKCPGNVTEWTKCIYETKHPSRTSFKIPQYFKDKYQLLKDYVYNKRDRCYPEDKIATKTKNNDDVHTKKDRSTLTITKDATPSTDICIASQVDLKRINGNTTKAQNNNIPIVSSKFIKAVQKPVLKFSTKQEKAKVGNGASSSRSGSIGASQKTMKIHVNGPATVHEESGLGMKAHVYQHYSIMLNSADVSQGTNAFYKMQLLESNDGKIYWLSRAWGRVGTTVGGSTTKQMDLKEAIDMFKDLYLQKSGNHWFKRDNFVKKPGCMFPIDLDYGQKDTKNRVFLKSDADAKLSGPLQDLICLIFDIEVMKKTLTEFEIDLTKMPLGNLSTKRIEMAYKVLADAQEILRTGRDKVKVMDVTNRFFTLIPHDFGLKGLPLLDNKIIIKMKIGMLDSLQDIHLAYNLLKDDGETGTDNPVNVHYRKLKTDIEVLTKQSNEYKIIEKYVQNTHASTHDKYTLKLLEVFQIKREGEKERYSKKFEKLHNKKLLWHGSRLTNYVGILSQGLRIAPREAPTTGYMFGKGIYFTDMVSKSANYCFADKNNHAGILLLCEVALGNVYERPHSEYIEKLPNNMHSTKGLGMTIPNPAEKATIDGVEVPYGKPVASNLGKTSLLYNEYIVYDIDQVNIKYLLKVDFNWK